MGVVTDFAGHWVFSNSWLEGTMPEIWLSHSVDGMCGQVYTGNCNTGPATWYAFQFVRCMYEIALDEASRDSVMYVERNRTKALKFQTFRQWRYCTVSPRPRRSRILFSAGQGETGSKLVMYSWLPCWIVWWMLAWGRQLSNIITSQFNPDSVDS